MDFLFILIVVVIAIVIIAMVKRNYDKGGRGDNMYAAGATDDMYDIEGSNEMDSDEYGGGGVVSGGITDF